MAVLARWRFDLEWNFADFNFCRWRAPTMSAGWGAKPMDLVKWVYAKQGDQQAANEFACTRADTETTWSRGSRATA